MKQPHPKRQAPRERVLIWFWTLAPLIASILGWSSYKALKIERDSFQYQHRFRQRITTQYILESLDVSLSTLFTRESALDLASFSSYLELKDSVSFEQMLSAQGQAAQAPLPALQKRAWQRSPLLGQATREASTGFAKLYFQLRYSQTNQSSPVRISLPGAPRDAKRKLALTLGHTTQAQIEITEQAAQRLIQKIGLDPIARLARSTALSPPEPLHRKRSFVPFFIKSSDPKRPNGFELVLLRHANLPVVGAVLQGIWYDWPRLRSVLSSLALKKLENGQVSLAPYETPLVTRPAAPTPTPPARANGGELSNLSLKVHVLDRSLSRPSTWTQTATTLAAAWAVFLCALWATHVALQRAVSLSRRRAQFASAVTHELRTPLTTLCMYAEMLAAGLVPKDQQADYYRTLKREADRLAGLIENVLDHARLESGRHVDLEELDFADWVSAQTARLSKQDVHVKQTSSGPILVHADPRGLERILSNLIDNAFKYGAAPVQLVVSKTATHAQFRLSDGGQGIAQPKGIFEPFFQGRQSLPHTASSSSTRGLGLGLSLSADLARSMGGELTLEHSGAGSQAPTTFLCSLPLAARQKSARTATGHRPS